MHEENSHVNQGQIYISSLPDSPLREGEIISDLTQTKLNLDTIDAEIPQVVPVIHPYAIIVSQDCDLDWDYRAKHGQAQKHKEIPGILFCEVAEAANLIQQILFMDGTQNVKKSRTWARVKINKDERYHFFQKVIPDQDALGLGLPELTVDFKRYFTLPSAEVYLRINRNEARRRCRLVSPYLEHFSSRFYYFQSRVALPEEHFSDPE